MDAAFAAAVRAAHGAEDDHLVAVTMLSVADGIDAALSRCKWDLDSIFTTVELLGRMPEGFAPTQLALGAFMAQQKWRDRYCDCAGRLHELLPRRKAVDQRKLALAWVRLALQTAREQVADKYTMMRVTLPLQLMQQSIGDLVKNSERSTFDADTRKELLSCLSRLSTAHITQSQQKDRSPYEAVRQAGSAAAALANITSGGGGGGGGGGAWQYANLLPSAYDLDSRTAREPNPNKVTGEYDSSDAYLSTHFHLLREDFVRPLRQAVEAAREGSEMPREVRVWRRAALAGMAVGNPGGVLFRIKLAQDQAEAEELDLAGGKTLINGALLLMSSDSFRTVYAGVVARREAARLLGDGSVFVSFSHQSEEEGRSPQHAPAAALEVAALAPLINRGFAVLEAGAYWGAYKPVLAALQATGKLASLPLGDCLMRSLNTERPPPYLGHVAAPQREKGFSRHGSAQDLARLGSVGDLARCDLARSAERALDGSIHSGAASEGIGTYDIRPILNVSDQATPYYIGDVRRDFPTEGWSGTSLDKWQLKAAKCLLTRRVGLVQGPPGTGKTFVGLLVVRTLLRNASMWASDGPSTDLSRMGSRVPSRMAASPLRELLPSRSVTPPVRLDDGATAAGAAAVAAAAGAASRCGCPAVRMCPSSTRYAPSAAASSCAASSRHRRWIFTFACAHTTHAASLAVIATSLR